MILYTKEKGIAQTVALEATKKCTHCSTNRDTQKLTCLLLLPFATDCNQK